MSSMHVALLLVATCSMLAEACNARGRPDTFENEAARIELTLISPTRVKLVERSGTRRGAAQVTQSWNLNANGSWSGYVAALESALVPPYRCSHDAAMLLCSRSLAGDAVHLQVERGADSEASAVRAELRAIPD